MTSLPPDPKIAMPPTDETIRDFAYHLYEIGGFVPGHDVDDWMEAIARLKCHKPLRKLGVNPE